MKKKFLTIMLICFVSMTSFITVSANNQDDTKLPGEHITYYLCAKTGYRGKTDDSSVYVDNRSGFSIDVRTFGAMNNNYSTEGVNCTYHNYAIVPSAKRLIHNLIYENGYYYCRLKVYTANNGTSGTLKGYWSPDSVGTYPYAN